MAVYRVRYVLVVSTWSILVGCPNRCKSVVATTDVRCVRDTQLHLTYNNTKHFGAEPKSQLYFTYQGKLVKLYNFNSAPTKLGGAIGESFRATTKRGKSYKKLNLNKTPGNNTGRVQ